MSRLNLYRWQAIDSRDRLLTGQSLAANEAGLLHQLSEQALLPVSWQQRRAWHGRSWKWQQKIDLVKQLATLLKAGLPLSDGLELLAQGHPHAGWQWLLRALRQQVLSGIPFSRALSQYPQIFPALYPALIQVGELTGQLDRCCERLAEQQAKQQYLWQKVSKALRYPLFILLVSLLVSAGMLLFVLPEFVTVYATFNAPLPAFTRMVMALASMLQNWGGVCFTLLAMITAGWQQLHRRLPAWQRWQQRMLLRLPLLATLWRGSQLSQIYGILHLTQQSGITLLSGLQAVEATLTARLWREAIVGLQQEIASGHSLYQVMQAYPLFTPLCLQLIHAGEEAGTLDTMLARLAEWHETQTLARADALAAALEPMMMLITGGIVGSLVIAIYLPVFGLGEVIR